MGIVTEVAGEFAHATPTRIAKFALESWGVKFSDHSFLDDGPFGAKSPPADNSEDSVVALAPSSVSNFTGTWRNVVNPVISYSFDQEGSDVTMKEFSAKVC